MPMRWIAVFPSAKVMKTATDPAVSKLRAADIAFGMAVRSTNFFTT